MASLGLEAQPNTFDVELSRNGQTADTMLNALMGDSDLETFMNGIGADYQDRGELRTSFNCISIRSLSDSGHTVTTVWEVTGASPVAVDSVAVFGIAHLAPRTLSNIVRPLTSMVASEISLSFARDLISGYKFLEANGSAYYAAYGNQKVAMVLPLKENFRNTVIATAGYQPLENGRALIAGEVQLHLENPFETASIADLWWHRKDNRSQVFSLSYEEPFFWRLQFGGRLWFYQNLQDGLYVMRKSRLSLVKAFSSTGKWSFGGENSDVKVTEDGKGLGLSDHAVRSVIVENEWEKRDSYWNPTGGFFTRVSGEVGDYSTLGSPNLILYRIQSRFEIIRSVWKRWILTFGGNAGYVRLSAQGSVPLSEQFRYGGASTLRGYREQMFHSNWMIITQIEVRYHLGGMSRIYLFVDNALHSTRSELPVAGGLGLQHRTPLGVLRVEYALNRHDSPSQGKIHVRLLGHF